MDRYINPSRRLPRWPTSLIREEDGSWQHTGIHTLLPSDIDAYDIPYLLDATAYYVREGRLYGSAAGIPIGIWESDGWGHKVA